MSERPTAGRRGLPARSAGRDLTVREAAWVLGESERAVRRLCEQGLLGAWRVVDPAGSSARLRWHIPSQALALLLRTEPARRRLVALVAGEITPPPRRWRPAVLEPPAGGAAPAKPSSLDSSE